MSIESLQLELENLVKETYGLEFRIAFNSKEWTLYITRSKTIFRGTLKEVMELAIEEFLSYRIIAEEKKKHVKNYKKYTYK